MADELLKHEMTDELLKCEIHLLTEGVLDPTLGPLWGLKKVVISVPSQLMKFTNAEKWSPTRQATLCVSLFVVVI